MRRLTYPTHEGIPVHPDFVNLPDSHLPYTQQNYNNHHLEFPARSYNDAGIIYSTLRNLESMQVMLPKDVHNMGKMCLHSMFYPPSPPSPSQAVDYLLQAHERGERLQYGCRRRRIYLPLDDELMQEIINSNFAEARRAFR